MPPRYAYWTILVDDQPTAFRAGSQEDLLPTLNRLKQKHPEAKMMWWQNGKLWPSRLDAQEAMRARGELGRRGDSKQFGRSSFGERGGGGFRDRKREPREERDDSGKLEWKPKGEAAATRERKPRFEKSEWKPKGTGTSSRPPHRDAVKWNPKDTRRSSPSHIKGAFPVRGSKPEWKPKDQKFAAERPEWRPKGQKFAAEGRESRRSAKREGGRAGADRGPQKAWSAKRAPERESGKLEWKPKGSGDGAATTPKRKWVPKEEYKKSQGIEARRDKNWRPGGEHKDPRQKYKDAKKAKWGRFKQNIRQKWEEKQAGPGARKKKRDE
jgi:hypothetical protein